MIPMTFVLDQLAAPVPGGIGRYATELAKALAAHAPDGCRVDGLLPSVDDEDLDRIRRDVPGVANLLQLALPRRELSVAWGLGMVAGVPRGILHAPSLMAPLARHERASGGGQVAVTVHDAVPWTHPETLSPRGVAWHKAMARRARKYADAVVVPTHAVAEQLAEFVDFGDRVRVIGGAVASTLRLPPDVDRRAAALGLPDAYVLAVGTLEPRKGIRDLITAMARPEAPDVPLLIVGPDGWGDVDVPALARDAGLAAGRVRTLGYLSDSDLAVALHRATVFATASSAEGFGLPLLEAMHFGRPTVFTDIPAHREVSAGSGVAIPAHSRDLPGEFAAAIDHLMSDRETAMRLGTLAQDRARAYSWADSAQRVWQLHADL